jgi:hypothetical protein
MGKMNPSKFYVLGILILTCSSIALTQVVNHKIVEAFLEEGEVGKAQKNLESYLGSKDLSFQDSVYILKNLGVLYSSSPKRKDLGDRYFYRLLDLDPFSSIHDTYASNTILARFKKIRKEYQNQRGGKALVPAVVVFDFQGEGIIVSDGVAMTQQFIAEMQRLEVFHTLDRSSVTETMAKMRVLPEKCIDKACHLDIARRLTADKLVSVATTRLDSVFTFTLTYIDAETGEATSTISKVYSKSPQKLLSEGFSELASDLLNHEAAWLNLSVTPTNTILSIDGTPMATISSRVPLNPGKHSVCGTSPGYEGVCKEFDVKRADALTYALTLSPKTGTQVPIRKLQSEEDNDEDGQPEQEAEGQSGHKMIWWTIGGMGVLAVAMAILFNSKN